MRYLPVCSRSMLLLTVILFSIFLELFTSTAHADDNINKKATIKLPKIFEWGRYKSSFQKVYPSLRDELARKKLFIANALKIFSHNLGFRLGLSSYYLSINQFSDKTPQEIKEMYNLKPDDFDQVNEHIQGFGQDDDMNELRGLTFEELQEEITRIIAEKRPGFEIIEEELRAETEEIKIRKRRSLLDSMGAVKNQHRRKRKQIDDFRSLNRPRPRESSKYVRKVLSTNSNYEPFELQSKNAKEGHNCSSKQLEEITLTNIELSDGGSSVMKQFSWLDNFFGQDGSGKLKNDEKLLAMHDNLNHSVGFGSGSNTEYKFPWLDDDDKPGMEDKLFLDLRESGCLTIPRDQGVCGSCYAFSTVTVMEWWHCFKTGHLVPFSEQYVIDCGNHIGWNGCKGGSMLSIAFFILEWGVELSHNYPYLGIEGTCPYSKDEFRQAGYKKPHIIEFVQERNIFKWGKILKESGPILIAIRTPPDFSAYGGSVHSGNNCIKYDTLHSMVLVGHGIEDGREYWLLRNSYGHNWGEGGYFKLAKDASHTCIYNALRIKVDFSYDESKT